MISRAFTPHNSKDRCPWSMLTLAILGELCWMTTVSVFPQSVHRIWGWIVELHIQLCSSKLASRWYFAHNWNVLSDRSLHNVPCKTIEQHFIHENDSLFCGTYIKWVQIIHKWALSKGDGISLVTISYDFRLFPLKWQILTNRLELWAIQTWSPAGFSVPLKGFMLWNPDIPKLN